MKDPIPRLEDLAEARIGAPGPGLPSHAPVVERPTLQLLLGCISEGEIGAFGSAERRAAEVGLIAGFLQQYGPHLARGGAMRPGQEGLPDMGWLAAFQEGDEHTQVRLGMVDSGSIDLHLSGRAGAVPVRVRQGPPRLSSRWVRVIVAGLHEDFMIPGVVQSLLESAGYVAGGEGGFILRAEHAGEHGGEVSAVAPGLGRCGVVVGIVRPPPADPTLSRLPKSLQDFGGGGAARIRVSHHSPAVPTPNPHVSHSPSLTAVSAAPVQHPEVVTLPRVRGPPPPHLPLPHPRQQPPSVAGPPHPAYSFQPSRHHLPLPPPPPPPRRGPPGLLSSQRRSVTAPPAHLRGTPRAFSHAPNQPRDPRGFVAEMHPNPTRQPITSSYPLTRALDPIIDMGAHLPGDFRGIGRFPSPPPGPAPLDQQRYVGGAVESGWGFPLQSLEAIGESRAADVVMADAETSGRDCAGRGLGSTSTPPLGFSTARFWEPMDIDRDMGEVPQETVKLPVVVPVRQGGLPVATAGVIIAVQDLAGPSRMDIDAASASLCCPTTPLWSLA